LAISGIWDESGGEKRAIRCDHAHQRADADMTLSVEVSRRGASLLRAHRPAPLTRPRVPDAFASILRIYFADAIPPRQEHPMIDLYYWTTPNGHKITMFLEETGLKYKIFPVNIAKGDQFNAEFLKIAPNNRIPAMLDHEPKGGGKPISIFESGAMLLYLAEKTGKFLPADIHGRYDTIQWTFWQMGGLGPMAGQNHHFRNYAVDKIQYAIDRYVNETNRLYGVLNKRLSDREFIAGDYSIADMASYPWVVPYKNQGQNIDDFPHLKRWLETIGARPATVRAYAMAKDINPNFGQPPIRTDEERKLLFGQTAAVVR
jgi:GSH-dependent disulfide-bond oxidoreductase